jgi:hypothetical protein
MHQSDDWPIAATAIYPTTEGENAADLRPIKGGQTMSAPFRWEIYEASDPALLEKSSGEVRMAEIKNPNAVRWRIDEPDDKQDLISTEGGAVLAVGESIEDVDNSSSKDQEASVLNGADKNVTQLVTLSLIAFLGIGILVVLANTLDSGMAGLIAISIVLCFIMVFISDLAKGKLSLEAYVKTVRKLLKGIGIKWK